MDDKQGKIQQRWTLQIFFVEFGGTVIRIICKEKLFFPLFEHWSGPPKHWLQSSRSKTSNAILFGLSDFFVPFETLSFIECGLFLVVVYDWAIIIQVNSITQHKSLPESKFQEHVSTSFHSHSNTLDWRVKHNVKTLYMQYIKSTQGVHVMTYCFILFLS